MRAFYSMFGTVHKAVVHLNGWQQQCDRRARTLSNLRTTIEYMQTQKMRYKGAQLHFPKMMKPKLIELKAWI